MKPQLRRVGRCESPVVVIDGFSGMADAAAAMAAALAPFPHPEQSLYPGVRRVITKADGDAFAYIEQVCSRAAQFIAGAFATDSFDLIEGSFSMVTSRPDQLAPLQRMPHFDSTDPNYVAVLHYLRVPSGTGTAFFRQRSTGIEQVTTANVACFIQTARTEAPVSTDGPWCVQGSDARFEELDRIDAVEDRLIIYRGSLLHSGIIPPDMPLSADPRVGRLTTNIFVQLH